MLITLDVFTKKQVGCVDLFRGAGVYHAAKTAALHALFAGIIILGNSLAEASVFPAREHTVQKVDFRFSQFRTAADTIASPFDQPGPDRFKSSIAFFSTISTDSEPVPDKQADEESNGAEGDGGQWVHWLPLYLFMFLLGFALGGGFGSSGGYQPKPSNYGCRHNEPHPPDHE